MTALTRVTFGENPVKSSSINQIIDAWNGNTAGVNQGNSPLALTGINDPINYAMAVRNADTVGKGLIIYAPDGVTPLLRVDKTNGVYASPDGVAAAAPILTTTGTQTLTNKTLTSPHMTGAVVDSGGLSTADGGYLQVGTTNPANSGGLRLRNSVYTAWRNNANTGDITLGFNSSDVLVIGSAGGPVATATVIGAAGPAAALPANPVAYLTVNINNSQYKIPYYNS